MKLINTIIAGAVTLATILGGATPARAHETIKHTGEYKIVLGDSMSTWKAVEYLLYGKNKGSERPILQQRKISEGIVGAYKHTLFGHSLPEIDKHGVHSNEWDDHMELIKRMRSDKSGYGEIPFLDWIRRETKNDEADGLAMDLIPGDHFYIPAWSITNKELLVLLDKKDGCEDHVIYADGTPVKVPKKKPHKKAPIAIEETPAAPIVELPKSEEPNNTSLKATAGYLTESLDRQAFMEGPRFDLDFDYTTGISDSWNLTVDTDNKLIIGSFKGTPGTATILDLEGAVLFEYELAKDVKGIKSVKAGIGPRVSILDANIDYDGNKAEIIDIVGGAEANATLTSTHFDATAGYSFSLGAGGDNMQGYNPIRKHKVDIEATAHLDPVHINAGYEFEHDAQDIRGVKRDNSNHTLEASVDFDITDNLKLNAGYELKLHEGNANDTTSHTFNGGVKFNW